MKQSEQIQKIREFSYQKMSQDHTGHNFDHIERVVKMATRISKEEETDPLLTIGAAYLHDVADDKLVSDPEKLEKEIHDFLVSIKLTDQEIEEILFTTHNLGFSKSLGKNPPKLSHAGQVVQDSDRLDAIGAIGITRAIYYGGVYKETIYDPNIKPRENMSKKEYRNLEDETIINHFYEKLLKLESMMNTETAKKIAKDRQQYMLEFLAEFKAEWNSEK